MILNFYIDPDHYPYKYQDNLSFTNAALLAELGSANTWLLWTLRTYLELKDHYNCLLTDKMPASGITFFFRGSVGLTQKPKAEQFWVCMVADGTWHPYSHVNLFQNRLGISHYPQSYFIRHWPQLNIIKSISQNTAPVNIYYFGDVANLAPELQSNNWDAFIKSNGFKFQVPDFSKWNDFSETDIVLGVRSFDATEKYHNKPSSKLINAWRANVVFIAGNDSAYEHERRSERDFISVKSYDELKKMLLKLKNDPELYRQYRAQTSICAERISDSFYTAQWVSMLEDVIIPLFKKDQKKARLKHLAFLVRRFFIYRTEALALRLRLKVINSQISFKK